jgi:arylsulfatase A-like enzyme
VSGAGRTTGRRGARVAGACAAALLLVVAPHASPAAPVSHDPGNTETPPGPGGWPPYTGPPNIVFILANDLGWGDLACYGNQFVLTPHLDQLASEGTRFTSFYTASPVGSPTRAAVLTGRFPGELAIHDALSDDSASNGEKGLANWLDPAVPTVTALLHDAGYATAWFGEWHLGSTPGAPDPGAYGIDQHVTTLSTGPTFPQQDDEFFRAESTTYIVDEAIQFIEANSEGPFFLTVATLLPHAPLRPTDAQIGIYANLAFPSVPYAGARRIYYASVTAMDEQIGRLVDRIDELGLAHRTLVVFTSDNGPQNINTDSASHSGIGSPGPFRGQKWSLYEGGLRTPFIARWLDHVPQGVQDDTSLIAAVDLLPTFCALAGVPVADPDLDGEDVSDMLLGAPRARTTSLTWEWRFGPNGLRTIDRSPRLAIRSGQWKLLLNPDSSRIELYDVVANHSELDNLAASHPDVVSQLSAEALAWQAALPPGPIDPEAGTNNYPWP